MKLLVLGGTVFLGRHIVEEAVARGHEVTLFNRGQANAGLFPELEQLRGDRDGGLDALRGRQWDAVVDPSGYVPRIVDQAARLLAGAAGHYTFISSLSVYPFPTRAGATEDSAVATVEDESSEDVAAHYGALKALCEQTVERHFPGRALHVRAGLIVGPYDPIERFAYWVDRVARGGEVLAPGRPERPVQYLDARDIAAWSLAMAERGEGGVFNVTGPARATTMGAMLEAIRAATGSDAGFTWVDEQFLLDREVAPFSDLPYWLPEEANGLLEVRIDRALAAGLTFRPVGDSARDVLAWDRSREPGGIPWPRSVQAGAGGMTNGLSPGRERDLLAEWHVRVDG